MPYRVVVNRELCISCGVAPSVCSRVFMLGDDNGKNRVVDEFSVELSETRSVGVVPDELYECVKTAAESCPVGAISVEKVSE